jgi:peptidyl-prolyl cis-trans isomerase D
MLGTLRRNKNNPLVLFMLGVVALLMVGFGISVQGLEDTAYAARVNGETISESEFMARYGPEYERRQQVEPSYDRKRAEADGLRRQVLDRMITEKLLAQRARRMGLAVDDEALREAILDMPDFRVNGRFDREQYQRVLRANGQSELMFEQNLRERLLAEKLYAALQGLGVSDRELREAFRRQETQVNLEWVRVPKSAFAPNVGTVTAADVKAWKSEVEDVDGLVTEFYKKNKETRYDVPKKACARHVLVRVDDSVPDDIAAEKEEKIAEAGKKIAAGEPFETVVEEYSEDANKGGGGSLGCFAYEDALPAVADAAFSLKPGEVSPIVQSGFGYHIVKLDRFEEEVRRSLDEVRAEIERELTAEARAKRQARELAVQILQAAGPEVDLSAALEEVKPEQELEVKQTGEFPVDRKYFSDLGFVPELSKVAFGLTEDEPTADAPVETPKGWVAVRLLDRIAPDEDSFASKKDTLENIQVTTKLNDVFAGWQKALQKSANVKVNPRVLRYGS